MYKLIPNFSLKHNNSFGLDVRASYWLTIDSVDDWAEAMAQYPHLAQEKKLIVGGGTNLLFVNDFDGLVVSPDITGYSISYQDDQVVDLEVGAGVEWDEFVSWCVRNGWYGVENLSLIPGKAGAAPVQNIGAYGAEAANVIVRVNGINLENAEPQSFDNSQCHFNYRSSIFKEKLLNLFMVTSVVFRLQKQGQLFTGYGDVEKTLHVLGEPTLENVRRAIIQIRESKLPDPKVIGNAGSFFKNPVVTEEVAAALEDLLPGLPVYQLTDGFVKIGAGFLIEKAGWKGHQSGQAAVHDRQALVLVNRGRATGQEILELSKAIQQDILEKYGVKLDREVQVVEG
jgi:UDP-N-acetylmuramate dehydrogenase